jgi:uncharacterized phage protein (TIGR02218 family)
MSAELRARLGRPLSAMALLWRLDRADGVTLGFTSHDRPLWLAGLAYRPAAGGFPSAAALSAGSGADGLAIDGTLVADAIRGDDLELGRWDGGRIALLAVDWEAPEAGAMMIGEGSISAVVRDGAAGGRFVLELVGDMAMLDAGGAPRTSPLCRAALGDRRCGVDLGQRRIEVRAVGAADVELLLSAEVPGGAGFVAGRARVLTGMLAGIDRAVMAVAGDRVRLDRPLGEAVAGALVRLEEGCDRLFATCRDRFDNAAAFDGEPLVPGTDALLRYGDA